MTSIIDPKLFHFNQAKLRETYEVVKIVNVLPTGVWTEVPY